MKHFIIVGNISNISEYLHIYNLEQCGLVSSCPHLEKPGGLCSLCGVRWLVALSAGNLNPPQPVPASAASPQAILLPDVQHA